MPGMPSLPLSVYQIPIYPLDPVQTPSFPWPPFSLYIYLTEPTTVCYILVFSMSVSSTIQEDRSSLDWLCPPTVPLETVHKSGLSWAMLRI